MSGDKWVCTISECKRHFGERQFAVKTLRLLGHEYSSALLSQNTGDRYELAPVCFVDFNKGGHETRDLSSQSLDYASGIATSVRNVQSHGPLSLTDMEHLVVRNLPTNAVRATRQLCTSNTIPDKCVARTQVASTRAFNKSAVFQASCAESNELRTTFWFGLGGGGQLVALGL